MCDPESPYLTRKESVLERVIHVAVGIKTKEVNMSSSSFRII